MPKTTAKILIQNCDSRAQTFEPVLKAMASSSAM